MSTDYSEDIFTFSKAEISTHPDLGFISLRLIRLDSGPDHDLIPSVLHRLSPEQAED